MNKVAFYLLLVFFISLIACKKQEPASPRKNTQEEALGDGNYFVTFLANGNRVTYASPQDSVVCLNLKGGGSNPNQYNSIITGYKRDSAHNVVVDIYDNVPLNLGTYPGYQFYPGYLYGSRCNYHPGFSYLTLWQDPECLVTITDISKNEVSGTFTAVVWRSWLGERIEITEGEFYMPRVYWY